jgi:hypothetical protein
MNFSVKIQHNTVEYATFIFHSKGESTALIVVRNDIVTRKLVKTKMKNKNKVFFKLFVISVVSDIINTFYINI